MPGESKLYYNDYNILDALALRLHTTYPLRDGTRDPMMPEIFGKHRSCSNLPAVCVLVILHMLILLKHVDIKIISQSVLNVGVLWWLLILEIHMYKYDLLSCSLFHTS